MNYTLQFEIANTPRLKRNSHVLKVLTDNDILSWNDLIKKMIPTKGLWASEIKVLNDIRNKRIRIGNMKNFAGKELCDILKAYASPHEATRIYNILVRNGIYDAGHVRWKSEEDLRAIYGIGPKSMDILRKIRDRISITVSPAQAYYKAASY